MLQPFNAFLSGFAATVGQFVLTASLRIQTNPENKAEFGTISHERFAPAAFVVYGVISHANPGTGHLPTTSSEVLFFTSSVSTLSTRIVVLSL